MKVLKLILVLCLFNVALLSVAENLPEKEVNNMSYDTIEDECGLNFGFIFNSNNILLDLNSYQGGIGGKLVFDNSALRASLGGGYESSGEMLNLEGSIAYQFSLYEGYVTPYAGALLKMQFEKEQSTDGDDFTKIAVFSTGVFGIIGAELFMSEYISVFAEYEIGGSMSNSTVSSRIDGLETKAVANNLEIMASVGNSTSIGIVLYIKPVYNIKEKNEGSDLE